MSRPSLSAVMPEKLREWLDAHLRSKGYGALIEASEHLKTQGFEIGKSSIHRYAQALRKHDQISGQQLASVTKLMSSKLPLAEAVTGRKAQILMELGRLKLHEHMLLEEMKGLLNEVDTGIHPETEEA